MLNNKNATYRETVSDKHETKSNKHLPCWLLSGFELFHLAIWKFFLLNEHEGSEDILTLLTGKFNYTKYPVLKSSILFTSMVMAPSVFFSFSRESLTLTRIRGPKCLPVDESGHFKRIVDDMKYCQVRELVGDVWVD